MKNFSLSILMLRFLQLSSMIFFTIVLVLFISLIPHDFVFASELDSFHTYLDFELISSFENVNDDFVFSYINTDYDYITTIECNYSYNKLDSLFNVFKDSNDIIYSVYYKFSNISTMAYGVLYTNNYNCRVPNYSDQEDFFFPIATYPKPLVSPYWQVNQKTWSSDVDGFNRDPMLFTTNDRTKINNYNYSPGTLPQRVASVRLPSSGYYTYSSVTNLYVLASPDGNGFADFSGTIYTYQDIATPTPTPSTPTPTPSTPTPTPSTPTPTPSTPTPTPSTPTPTPTPTPIYSILTILSRNFNFYSSLDGSFSGSELSSGSGNLSENGSFSSSGSVSLNESVNRKGNDWMVVGSYRYNSGNAPALSLIAAEQNIWVDSSTGFIVGNIYLSSSPENSQLDPTGLYLSFYNGYFYIVEPINMQSFNGSISSSSGSFSESGNFDFSESGSFSGSGIIRNPDYTRDMLYSVSIPKSLFQSSGIYDLTATINRNIVFPPGMSGFTVSFDSFTTNQFVNVIESGIVYINGTLSSHIQINVLNVPEEDILLYIYGSFNPIGTDINGNLNINPYIFNLEYKVNYTSEPLQDYLEDTNNTIHDIDHSLTSADGANSSANSAIEEVGTVFGQYEEMSDTSEQYGFITDDLFTFDTSIMIQLAPTITLFTSCITSIWGALGDFSVVLTLFLVIVLMTSIIGVYRFVSSSGTNNTPDPPKQANNVSDSHYSDKYKYQDRIRKGK